MMQFKAQESAVIRTVLPFLLNQGPIYLVGGAVRDAILNKPSHDFDFIIGGDVFGTARKLADSIHGAFYILDREREYARVIIQDQDGLRNILDFAPIYKNDLNVDLHTRDFTINAIAWDISAKDHGIIDPCNGLGDLEQRVLRPCSLDCFADDPVRIIRVARFAVEYQLDIAEMVDEIVPASIADLANVSEERKRDEIFKIFENHNIDQSLGILLRYKVLEQILPEIYRLVGFQQHKPHIYDGWQHSMQALRFCERMADFILEGRQDFSLSNKMKDIYALIEEYMGGLKKGFFPPLVVDRSLRSVFLFAAVHHDIGKPLDEGVLNSGRMKFPSHAEIGVDAVEKCANRMALSRVETRWIKDFIQSHMLLHNIDLTDSEAHQRLQLYRFFQEAKETSPFVALFTLADLLATYGDQIQPERWQAGLQRCRMVLNGWFNQYDVLVNPVPFLNGNEIQVEFAVKQGKQLGEILEGLCQAQAAGEVRSKQEARSFIQVLLKEVKE